MPKDLTVKKTGNSTYIINSSRNFCEILVEGDENLDTIIKRYNVILNDKEWCSGMNVIVDMTKVHTLALSGQDLEILGYHHNRLVDNLDIGILCFITKQGYMYGIGRILESLAGQGGQKVHVCCAKDEALKILGIQA